jgi:hypothetical protein
MPSRPPRPNVQQGRAQAGLGTAVRVAHFLWAPVRGAHIERDGKERPKRTPSHAEMLQAERTGLSAEDLKQKITELWQRADSGTRWRRPMGR